MWHPNNGTSLLQGSIPRIASKLQVTTWLAATLTRTAGFAMTAGLVKHAAGRRIFWPPLVQRLESRCESSCFKPLSDPLLFVGPDRKDPAFSRTDFPNSALARLQSDHDGDLNTYCGRYFAAGMTCGNA